MDFKNLLIGIFISSASISMAPLPARGAKLQIDSNISLDPEEVLELLEEDWESFQESLGFEACPVSQDSKDENDDKKYYMCKMIDELSNQLRCYVRDYNFENLPSSGERANILACFRNGEVEKHKRSWFLEGEIGIKIAEFLTLVGIKGSINDSTERVKLIYECKNTYNGEIYIGTLDSIAQDYKRFLHKKEEREKE